MKKKQMNPNSKTFRFPKKYMERLLAVAKAINKKVGMEMPLAQIMRNVVERGVTQMEKELKR